MMSFRVFAGVVAAVMIVAAGFVLFLPIEVAEQVSCGPAVAVDTARAARADKFAGQVAPMYGSAPTDYVGACRSQATLRRVLGYPAGVIGVVVLAGAVLVRAPVRVGG